jgi:diketogulonate reductase-like aldo/keto reductase
MVNQILVHIANTPHDLISYSHEQGLLVEAYSPIAHGELLKNERVREIADKSDVSVPQLSIRYTLQLGLLPLPKTENPEHMKSNAQVDFDISDEDMETLKSIDPLDDYARPAPCQCSAEASLEDPTAHEGLSPRRGCGHLALRVWGFRRG